MNNSLFATNTANDANAAGNAVGGAIAVMNTFAGAKLSVTASWFQGNVAIGLAGTTAATADGGYGGAIGVINTAAQSGVITGSGTTFIVGSTFNANAAQGGGGAAETGTNNAGTGGAGLGGAIMTAGTLSVSGQSKFAGNGALGGAGGAGDPTLAGNGGAGGAAAGARLLRSRRTFPARLANALPA